MAATLSVFVNERRLAVPEGADVLAAVRAFDPSLEVRLADRSAYVTDGRGLPIPLDAPLSGGAILRVVVSSRRPAGDS